MHFNDCDVAARNLIDQIGKTIVIGIPLGLGKPIGLINALYLLAEADQSIDLTILTGLTLTRPRFKKDLEKRFAEPIVERLLGDFEDPLYESARLSQRLPKNIRVLEFFFSPGKYLSNSSVQQDYISTKYTSALRDLFYYSMNVIAQLVASSDKDSHHYSLSSNSDLFFDAVEYLKAARKPYAVIGEINTNLPFMVGDALVPLETFTHTITPTSNRSLFALPRDELAAQDLLIGLYASCLVKDNSCLQIGIGKLGTAIGYALITRQNQQANYDHLLSSCKVRAKFGDVIERVGDTSVFSKGLYASTEMFSDEYIELYQAGILKKRVYDHVILQDLLNRGEIREAFTPDILDMLVAKHVIQPHLSKADVSFLQQYGILKSDIDYQSPYLILPSGEKIEANLADNKAIIISQCLGKHLAAGKLIHAGFFLGSEKFYQALRQLSPEERNLIDMTTIARTNSLNWNPQLLRLQRQTARFINSAMMITLDGAVVSDGLKNHREVSGVGGQFDFVDMAHELADARGVIVCRSTRKEKNQVISNVIWEYENITIPRYLRDIVITEYGIADLRSKTDSEVMKALLNITDSRFQQQLLKKAKQYGKINSSYEIPEAFRNNTPEAILQQSKQMQTHQYYNHFPFGTELTNEELAIKPALTYLKNLSVIKIMGLFFTSFFVPKANLRFKAYLQRLNLLQTKTIKEYFYKKIVIAALSHHLKDSL